MNTATKQLHRNAKLKAWLREGGIAFRDLLLQTSGSSLGMLRQWTTGRRNPSAAMAGEIVDAMEKIKQEFPEAPNPLNRGDLCEACARCPHFQDSMIEVDDLK